MADTRKRRPVPAQPGPSAPYETADELTLERLLDDDMVKLMMASDGVSPDDIRALARISPLVGSGLTTV